MNFREAKDAEGARLVWVNLSGERTEVQVLADLITERSFCVLRKFRFLLCLAKKRGKL